MENPYLPDLAEIVSIREETPDTKTFALRFCDPRRWDSFAYRPGQFVEVSVFGAGEAPFCLASARDGAKSFDITVRSTGALTRALHEMEAGQQLGVRGPLGNGFPLDEVKGRDILFVGGGIGLPPLRPLISTMLAARQLFGSITVLYGARTPADLVYKDELERWRARPDMEFMVTVDAPDERWKDNVGVVTALFPKVSIRPSAVAFVCGPPIMIRFVVRDLLEIGLAEDSIITTLERHMRCGIGKCNHCLIGDKYVCTDGPVFNYRQMKAMMNPG
ncbi:MAG: FAD/NAD(P)-binding protein [Armatimonadota bacterium]